VEEAKHLANAVPAFRSAEGIFPPKIIRDGQIALDPPGLILQTADLLPV